MIKNKLFLTVSVSLITIFLFFFLRLSNLNGIPVFVDEAIYVRWSQVMKNEANLRFLPQTDGKQPLFMWSIVPFFKITSDPLIAGRLVSVATGFGSLLGVGFLSYFLFNNVFLSAITSFIYALLPFTVFFDRMALTDSMLAMFGIWSLTLSVLFSKTKKLEHAMFLGFALGGGLLTKSPAVFFYVWLGLCLLYFLVFQKEKKPQIYKIAIGLLAVIIISQAMYAILRLGPSFEQIGARNQDYLFTWREVLGHPLNPLLGNLGRTTNWLWLLFGPTILLLIALGLIPQKTRTQAIFLILVSLVPLFAQAAIAKVYTSRYALFAVLPLVPVLGLGLHWLVTRKGILINLSSLVIITVPLIISIITIFKPEKAPLSFDMRNGYLEEWTAGWGQKEIARYLLDLEAKGGKVVVFTEGYFGTLPDGLQIYTEGHKNIIIVGSNPYVSSIPEGLLNTSPDNQRYLVINKSRNHLTPDATKKLQLIKEYPKAIRLDGTQEVLQFYRYQANTQP